MKVLSFGEILWDIIENKPYLGGAPFNGASHLAKCGVTTYMISRLGKDELGQRALAQAQKIGVQTDFIQWDDKHPTGTVNVFLQDGQPSYTIHRGVAYDFIEFRELEDAGLHQQNFDIFSFGTLAQREHTSASALRRILQELTFGNVFYDVNLRKDCYTPEIIRDSLPYSTILKLNDEEVLEISGMIYGRSRDNLSFCQSLSADFDISIIIITAGEKGCFVFQDGRLITIPGQKVKVVDTVGAGDSFSAAFLFKYFQTGDAATAAAVANQVGAFVASSRGPIPEYSSEIRALLGL